MELTGKAKLVFEACAKINQGEDMIKNGHILISEGKIELTNLIGEVKLPVIGNIKKAKKSKFRKETRTDDEIANLIVEMVRKSGPHTTSAIQDQFNMGDRRVVNILNSMAVQGRIKDMSSGKGNGLRHSWVLLNSAASVAEKIVHTRVGKTGRPIFDETKYVESALSFLKTHDWVTKGKLLEHLEISSKPGNRLFDYLEKQKLVRQVAKRNNPGHKHNLSIYNQEYNYWEAVV